jgi:hypothetical protein
MSFAAGIYDHDKTYEDGKQFSDDDKLYVKFEVRAVRNEFKSNQEGRPIFYDQEYIQIIVPGSRDISTFPLDDHYKGRFRKAYDKWKANTEATTIDGTLLSELPWLSKSQIAELNYSNIHTVEQLANLSDANALKFMGNHSMRERAKNYLAAAAGEAPMLKLQAELEQRDNHIQVLTRKVEELTAAFEKLDKKNR